MSGGNEFKETALWRRWRDGAAEAGRAAAEPDALTLAAYVEHRLGRPGIDPETDPALAAVEAWLVDHTDALDDILAARSMADPQAPTAVIARAQGLIVWPEGNVLTLHSAPGGWRRAAAWSGIAASMIAAVLVGFSLGTSDIIAVSDTVQSPGLEQALIGPSTTIITPDDEESGT